MQWYPNQSRILTKKNVLSYSLNFTMMETNCALIPIVFFDLHCTWRILNDSDFLKLNWGVTHIPDHTVDFFESRIKIYMKIYTSGNVQSFWNCDRVSGGTINLPVKAARSLRANLRKDFLLKRNPCRQLHVLTGIFYIVRFLMIRDKKDGTKREMFWTCAEVISYFHGQRLIQRI